MKKAVILSLFLLYSAYSYPQEFSFVYLPDIHLRPDSAIQAGFEQMVSKVNKLHPDFVLTGGDMIYTAKTVNGEKAKVLFDYMDKEFSLFRMPVKMTMGNHENVGITAESGINSTDRDWGKRMFERRYHKRYYSFIYNGWKFFILDGIKILEESKNYTQGIDSVQIEWLRTELKSTDKTTPLVISMHTPFINPESVISSASRAMSPVCDTVLNMFKDHNLRIVLEGHTHRYMNLYYQKIHYLSGGSSEINTDENDRGFYLVKAGDGGEEVRFVPLPGPGKEIHATGPMPK